MGNGRPSRPSWIVWLAFPGTEAGAGLADGAAVGATLGATSTPRIAFAAGVSARTSGLASIWPVRIVSVSPVTTACEPFGALKPIAADSSWPFLPSRETI